MSEQEIFMNQKSETQKNKAERAVQMPIPNRKYKDNIFRMLFSEPEHLLSLYNAVAGTDYEDPQKLQIVTLDSAVYMGMKNDIAFVLDTGLYLYEHQSTWNPNMPLRDLFYIASEYQVLVDDKSLYSSVLQKLPAPRFIVFYNGSGHMADFAYQEDVVYLRLSDAYESRQEEPELELKVAVYNINEGHNKKLMEQCRSLAEYASYVARVRRYAAQLPLNEAVEKAVTECIEEGILKEFLSKNRAEVVKVSIFEYDKEKEEKKLRKAEYEAGWQDGQNDGWNRGMNEGRNQGIEQGIEQGMFYGICAVIDMGKEFGLTDMAIAQQLQKKLGIEEKEAMGYLEKDIIRS